MYYLETGVDKHTRFRNAVILAMGVHIVLILSVSFESARATPSSSTQIEVTLTTRPSAQAPEDAKHIAQANQDGSGDLSEQTQITSQQNMPAIAEGPEQVLAPKATAEAITQDVVTTTGMARRTASKNPDEMAQTQQDLQGISPEVDRLSQELASLQAELDEQTRNLADKPRVRRLTSASARQSADAAYLLDWRRRLEAVGNKYYPQASVRYGIYGDVRLLVVIRKDGSLEDVRILSSSGYAVLDEASIKVVRMAAPYSPFPPELAATTDKLEIIRTWQYLQNELSSEKGLQASAATH